MLCNINTLSAASSAVTSSTGKQHFDSLGGTRRWWLLVLVVGLTAQRSFASEVRVVLSGTGVGTKEFHHPDGWWQRVTYNAVVSLHFRPHSLVAQGNYFVSERANATGSIRFYGVAEDHFFGSTEIWNFDVTRNYTLVDRDVYTLFLRSNGSVDYIGTSLPYASGSAPVLYGLKFEGASGVFTNFVDLGSFWWFNDLYPIPATATVTGNESTLSGTVTDHCRGTPVSNATLKLTSTGFNQTLQTDANGRFQASGVPPGPLTIAVSAPGYQAWSSTKLLAAFSSADVAMQMTNLPVILVYGWHGTTENWDLIKSYLELDCYDPRVLEYDDTLAPAAAAAALNAEVTSVLASTGATKVNLIAHSYGGLVSRHFIEEMGHDDKVENLIMIATPNHGSRLADYLAGSLVEQPQAGIVEYFLDFYGALFRADRDWGSTLALRTVQNDYLDNLNLLFGSRLPGLTTRYHVIAGTEPYPAKFSSHETFLPGPDDGAVAARSARLSAVPLHCVPLNHSAIVNPRLVREWYDSTPNSPLAFTNTAALDEVLAMYTDIIRPILEGNPPASNSDCADGQDPNDNQPLVDVLEKVTVGVNRGDVVNRNFLVVEDTSAMTVTFTHEFSEFDFCLLSPAGQVICATNAQSFEGVSFIQAERAMSFRVDNPQAGQWALTIRVIDIPDQGEDLNIYVLSQTDLPRLMAESAGGQVLLSWTAANTFGIESRNSLSPSGQWSAVTNVPSQTGDKWTVSLPTTNSAAFYRLRKQ